MSEPESPTPILRELRRIRHLLEQLVEQGEERRAAERQLEEFGAILAGGDSQQEPGFSDTQLIDAFYRKTDGGYGLDLPDGSRRDATPDEAERLDKLVRPSRKLR